MGKVEKDVKSYALDELREYLVYNDVSIESKDDLVKVYVKMHNQGYFFKAEINNVMNEVKQILNEFGDAYEKDHDILEKDLIFFGSKKVLEKLNNPNKTKQKK